MTDGRDLSHLCTYFSPVLVEFVPKPFTSDHTRTLTKFKHPHQHAMYPWQALSMADRAKSTKLSVHALFLNIWHILYCYDGLRLAKGAYKTCIITHQNLPNFTGHSQTLLHTSPSKT